MAKTSANCRTCRFFVSDGDFNYRAEGSCCRRAPRRLSQNAECLTEYDLWPIVRGGMWCGEFEMADDREVED